MIFHALFLPNLKNPIFFNGLTLGEQNAYEKIHSNLKINVQELSTEISEKRTCEEKEKWRGMRR